MILMTDAATRRKTKKAPPAAAPQPRNSKRKQDETAIANYIGGVIRGRRKELGLSQERLGESLGITFQQIQKYEKGTNRVSAPTLMMMAELLKVPIDYFFPKDGKPLPMPPMPASAPVRAELERLADRLNTVIGKLEDGR